MSFVCKSIRLNELEAGKNEGKVKQRKITLALKIGIYALGWEINTTVEFKQPSMTTLVA